MEAALQANLRMFLCTYKASLSGVRMDVVAFVALLRERWDARAQRDVLEYHSNHGHSCPVAPKPGRKQKPRRADGDGTSFNWQVTFTVAGAGRNGGRGEFFVKLFTSKGEVQIPNISREDFSDAAGLLDTLCAFLADLLGAPVAVTRREPVMMNYLTSAPIPPGRCLNLYHLAAGMDRPLPAEPPRPYEVLSVMKPSDRHRGAVVKLGFPDQRPSVRIFNTGKINILGLKTRAVLPCICAYVAEQVAAAGALQDCPVPDKK